MHTLTKDIADKKAAIQIAIIVLLSCWALFYLDHETRSVTDLFKIGNLVALFIYYVPTFLITYLFYIFYNKRYVMKKSIRLSLITGIPVGLASVIAAMVFLH